MIQTIETYEDGVLIESRQVEVPDPPDVSPVQDIADALTANPDAFPPDILAALRAALGMA